VVLDQGAFSVLGPGFSGWQVLPEEASEFEESVVPAKEPKRSV
jgi:hypothetical protein